jgi:hypothetical protein
MPATEVWAYMNMYNFVVGCRPGDVPGTAAMVKYRITNAGDVAEIVIAADAT